MYTIDVVGVGLTADDLTRAAMELMNGEKQVVLHTGHIGAADWLAESRVAFTTLDELYEQTEDFDEHADAAAEAICRLAERAGVVYGVIDLRDESVARLLRDAPEAVRLHPGVPVDGALSAFYTGGTYCACASDYEAFQLRADQAALIREIDSATLASEVKLKLMDVYPDENPVTVLSGGAIQHIVLEDLDRIGGYDHRFCALVERCENLNDRQRYGFDDLLRIVAILRDRNGCPWDRAQTHQSFKPLLIEEAYEVADAIDAEDPYALADELGDVLFEVVSHADIARRADEFDITDATTAICRKMIHRHPRLFNPESAKDLDSGAWTRLKMEEKQLDSYSALLRQISRSLPATTRAMKVQKRIAEAGVPETDAGAWRSVLNASIERLTAVPADEAALGEALFALCALAGKGGIDPELALNGVSQRWIERFERAEQGTDGEQHWNALDVEQKHRRWEECEL